MAKDLFLVDAIGEKLKWESFNYICKGGDLSEEHDVGGWKEITETIENLKFTKEQHRAIWRCTAAVIFLGQIEFDKGTFGGVEDNKPGSVKNMDVVEKIIKLLGITNGDFFKKILVESRIVAGKEVMWKANPIKKATDNRDALAKQLFNNLFDWLVIVMNKSIEPADISDPGFLDTAKSIGLLDIFGFENFAFNNYEQLCINYVNEKLHKLYIAAIFEAECVELKEEGLGHMVDAIQYPDLKVLDILRAMDFKTGGSKYAGIKFDKPPPPGLFTTTDDQCV